MSITDVGTFISVVGMLIYTVYKGIKDARVEAQKVAIESQRAGSDVVSKSRELEIEGDKALAAMIKVFSDSIIGLINPLNLQVETLTNQVTKLTSRQERLVRAMLDNLNDRRAAALNRSDCVACLDEDNKLRDRIGEILVNGDLDKSKKEGEK